jgi:two-component system phosphate regulon sensor histidine kinase PhoR
MQSYYEREASLHQILVQSDASPEYIQVKPKGFKAILQATVEFLETQQIQSNLFFKLPAETVWTDDIHRYGQTLSAQYRLFNFTRLKAGAPLLPQETSNTKTELIIPLHEAQTWRGEYFLLAQAEQFALLVIAYRLQPLSASPLSTDDDDETDHTAPLSTSLSIAQRRPSYLSVCCSINPHLVAQVGDAVQSIVEHLADTSGYSSITELATHWDHYWPEIDTGSLQYLAMADRWLNWQLKLQESLRQTVSSFRRQAMNMSSLSSQNEVLMNTLRLKDDFLNTVGQELRTPLTTIKTALTLLDSPNLKPPQRRRYMDMICTECDRQSALIKGVLNLLQMETSISHTEPKPLYLAETVPPVVSTYQPLALEKGIMLAYTVPDDLPPVNCPAPWVRQIMIHLLNNSIKYTESGGEVWVTAHQRDDFAEVEVRDTGIGISASDLPKIFEHFYRGRNLPQNESEGAGLGLSIVQQLLMYCGGTVLVDSEPAKGTTFLVRLPLHQG